MSLARLIEGDLCLVLGAGASTASRVPDWRLLAKQLLREGSRGDAGTSPRQDPRVVGPPERDLLDSLEVDEAVAFEVGESLRVSRSDTILETVRRLLYESASPPARTHREPVDFLARIAVLASVWATKKGRDHGFHVVTYNYDSLLEEAVKRQGQRAVALVPSRDPRGPLLEEDSWKPTDWDSRLRRNQHTVRILHPHGLLLRDRSPELDGVSHIMLRASDYDSRGGSLRFVENAAQLEAFTARTCLFHGFSFRDAAVRRLLRIAAQVRATDGRRGLHAFAQVHPHLSLRRMQFDWLQRVDPEAFEATRAAIEATWCAWGVRILWSFDREFRDQISFLDRLGSPVSRLDGLVGLPTTFDFDEAVMDRERRRLRWGLAALHREGRGPAGATAARALPRSEPRRSTADDG